MEIKEKVYELLRTIPKGKVAANFGFGGGEVQRSLLEKEGVIFDSDGRIDLKIYGVDLTNFCEAEKNDEGMTIRR